jgi:hypothetical protein
MQFQALEALKAYGRWETLAQRGTAFMDRYPRAVETPSAGILVADAYANLKNETEEFKVYSRLLDLLNAQPHRFVAGEWWQRVKIRLQPMTHFTTLPTRGAIPPHPRRELVAARLAALLRR